MDALVQAKLDVDGSVPAEYTDIHDSAVKALREAMRDHSEGLDEM